MPAIRNLVISSRDEFEELDVSFQLSVENPSNSRYLLVTFEIVLKNQVFSL